MVGNGHTSLRIVRTESGEKTGEQYYQTEDGQWWKDWDGVTRTGEELRTKIGDIVE
jgi:hypothetical protein